MSGGWYYFAVCVVMVACTAFTRTTFALLPSRWQLPPTIERALRFAPPCALSAIIVPTVLTDHGHLVTDLANPRLWGVVAGAAVYTYRRSMLLMTIVGMAVFTLLRLTT